MKKLLFFILVLGIPTFPQWSMPAGYTNFLKLRYYNLDAQPGADSIRANLEDIDNFAKTTNDTLLAMLLRMNNVISYAGNLKNSVISYDNFNLALKNKLVTKDLNETITGIKTFNNLTYLKNAHPSADLAYNIGSPTYRWSRGYYGSLYTNYLVLTDPTPTGSDTSVITFNGSKIIFQNDEVQFNAGVTIVGEVTTDSVKFDGSVTYYPYYLTVNKGDSTSLSVTNTSLIFLEPSDNVPVVKYLGYYKPAGDGAIVYLVNTSLSYTITFKDDASGGNLLLSADFTMGRNDVLVLMRVYQGFNTWAWVEVSRSDN